MVAGRKSIKVAARISRQLVSQRFATTFLCLFPIPASSELSPSCQTHPDIAGCRVVLLTGGEMVVMAWNVRGLGNRVTVRALKNSMVKFKPNIVFLSETKQKKRYLEKIKMKMKMDHSFYVEPSGLAGGLSLWWTNDTQVTILKHGKHFIDAMISVNGETEWFGTFIYGPPYREEKQAFWESMTNLRSCPGDRWLVIGDTNVVASQEEKIGGAPFNPSDARHFYEFVDSLGLLELPISGGNFTWSNHRSDEDSILEKLDRALCSFEWSSLFPKAIGVLDVAMGSDHAPIIILSQGMMKKYKKEFKFESKWLLEDECTSTVQKSWDPISQPRISHRFGSKLRRTKYSLIKWSKLKSRVNNQKKQELLGKIKSLQGKHGVCPLCTTHWENALHAFRECIHVQDVLTVAGFDNCLPVGPFSTCHDWLLQVMEVLEQESFTFFVALLWSIWNRRNRWVHDSQLVHARIIVENVRTLLADFEISQ
ncbi:hypothetical protein V6N11_031836 [Hibiscus sabdariffa]|uniref:Endonuclease/exonuclease/phosphatase domain-containing protein n=1 Tax=Hibiscus sabdariffa TaxID=183260 RepID=A0ABR2SZK2_9ROSI